MLYVGHHHCGCVQVELLNSVVSTQCKKAGPRAVDCEPPDVVKSRDSIVGDVFCPHIPRDGFTANSTRLATQSPHSDSQSQPVHLRLRVLNDPSVL